MIYVFYFFALLVIITGSSSLRGGFRYLDYFRKELAGKKPEFSPPATVFVPCRGLDSDLRENLSALFDQQYPVYEIIFVADDRTDPAVGVIENLIARPGPVPARLVIAGKAAAEGQKVHNLRRAVPEAAEESRVFVFMDSDARPGRQWLGRLIAPLADRSVGCATGYRWFIPRPRSLAAELRSVWNASIASALGARQSGNFCWGGATAIRREVFENLGIRRQWRGTVSDDFVLTNALKKASLGIYFVPQCLTATVEGCGWREFLEFSTRQMKITRIYSPDLWKVSLAGSFLFTVVMAFGIGLLFFTAGLHFWAVTAALGLIFLLGAGKAWLRLRAVRLVLKQYRRELDKSFWPQLILWVITPAVFLYNDLRALGSNEIVWRGIKYKLEAPDRTKILRNG